jgi:hypothetical protein
MGVATRMDRLRISPNRRSPITPFPLTANTDIDRHTDLHISSEAECSSPFYP